MENIINNSTCKSREQYGIIAASIAKKYPDYTIVVDGGAYRPYCVSYEVDRENKTIKLDYYIPYYINAKKCNKWVVNEIMRGNTCGSAGLGFRKAITAFFGPTSLTEYDRLPTPAERENVAAEYEQTYTETENGFEVTLTRK